MSNKGAAVLALKKAALLDINKGQLDKAVTKLQKLIQVTKSRDDAEAGKGAIPLWAMLGEAYKKQKNLQSASRVFKHVLEIDPNSLMAHLQLMSIYQSMGMYPESLEEARVVKELQVPENLVSFVDLQYSFTAVLLAKEGKTWDEKMELLKEVFHLLQKLLTAQVSSTYLLKTLSSALFIIQNFYGNAFEKARVTLNLANLGITSKVDLVRKRLGYLKQILERNPKFSDSWNDLALGYLDLHSYTKNEAHVKSAIHCLESAISNKVSIPKKSMYWLNLGICYGRLLNSIKSAHCFIRSLQLNKSNDKAWCALSLLLLRVNQKDSAFQAMQLAQQTNTDLMCTWFAHALHAHKDGHFDAMDLFRHTIVLKPHHLGIRLYSKYLSKELSNKNSISRHTLIDAQSLLRLPDFAQLYSKDLLSIAYLAEQFWYLEEASQLVTSLQNFPFANHNFQRILMKASRGKSDQKFNGNLVKLSEIFDKDINEIIQILRSVPRYEILLNAIDKNNMDKFVEVYTADLYPLVICYLFLTDKEPTEQLKQALRTKRPLHYLADVYPAGMRSKVELQYQQDEGIVTTEDNLTTELYSLLLQRKESQKEEEEEPITEES